MNESAVQILQTSDDPKALGKAAVELAHSGAADDHDALCGSLRSPGFLARLHTEAEYEGPARRLRLRRVMEELVKNSAPSARAVLIELTASAEFNAEGSRTECLIPATASIESPPAELLAFWETYSQPDDGFTPLTITALLDNASRSALDLFETKLLDAEHDIEERIAWLRFDVFTHRHVAPVIECCRRLFDRPLPAELRTELIDVLFDYKPAVWFTPSVSENPPPWTSYSNSARDTTRDLGRYLLDGGETTPEQSDAIRETLAALGEPSNESATE